MVSRDDFEHEEFLVPGCLIFIRFFFCGRFFRVKPNPYITRDTSL